MLELIQKLFPQLNAADFVYVNMEEMAKELKEKDPDINLLDQAVLAEKLKEKANGSPYCFGGYLEDRKTLWKGHYMEEGKTVHYGVDITVPPGTLVHMPTSGLCVYRHQELDQDGGWGGKVVIYCNGKALILGHLDLRNYGGPNYYAEGGIVGEVGDTDVNGGWWPHLHVQVMDSVEFQDTDGYGYADNQSVLPPETILE